MINNAVVQILQAEKKFNVKIIFPFVTFIIAWLLHHVLPDAGNVLTEPSAYPVFLTSLILLYLFWVAVSFAAPKLLSGFLQRAPIFAAVFLILALWDLVTLKLRLVPLPFFPEPGRVLAVYLSDWEMLGTSLLHSLRLQFTGYFIGAALGLLAGIGMGWSKKIGYWFTPLVKILGPIPATAWIPVALTIFPTSFSASVFLVAMAVWFPVTIMSSSGIAGVPNAYFDVARTLGADNRFLIFKVAIPAALPLIFIGLFMGLTTSFLALIVAEMLGVKAGLGWYISWAQSWAEYDKVYAVLIIISFVFSSLITILFKIRDRVLVWQKGVVKW
ncbi:MAG: ABC transporter permease subunit [Clostridia bacterium]|nr:ABC transporter permease subunit [Clostridia bacterium]